MQRIFVTVASHNKNELLFNRLWMAFVVKRGECRLGADGEKSNIQQSFLIEILCKIRMHGKTKYDELFTKKTISKT